ncbi:MAG: serine hydrolase [Myxococcales bacterium]|nr:serine hydrolase [Myxococcales bacterium]
MNRRMERPATAGALLAVLACSACLADNPLKLPVNMVPELVDGDWPVSSPEAEGMDEAAVRTAYERFFSENAYVTGLSLLVVRHGKLLAEGYTRSTDDRDVPRNIQSVTKGHTALLVGIALEHGHFEGLDQPLHDVVPEDFGPNAGATSAKLEITLGHLLTMRSGLAYPPDDFTQELHRDRTRGQMAHILRRPLATVPGEAFEYKDCDPQLLSGALRAATGMAMHDYAADVLWAPLGVRNVFWETNVDGDAWGAQALYLRPRDLAKIGQLLVSGGLWRGERIVDQAWINALIEPQHKAPPPPEGFEQAPGFGMMWWVAPERGGVYGRGTAGQYLAAYPELDLVIVQTAEPYADDIGGYFAGPGSGSFMDLANALVLAIGEP